MNCPFIDSANPHCSVSLNMQHLEDAFEICTGHYELCPVFIQMSRSELEPVGSGAKASQGENFKTPTSRG